ncbi:hypothetical protein E2562_009094 [Oryza meyeriana var. granulata]|uniref:Uncharacterized protein n=1 Tax=Oryza meyeriana var. granulata TaxID=110450 RepID=A0A6G1D133_9ORYZ|nr:hypothetical protein E2562_009094 [Oryza meyeriana var. granulata]
MRPLHFKDVALGPSTATPKPASPRWSLPQAASRSRTVVAALCPSAEVASRGAVARWMKATDLCGKQPSPPL